MYLLNIQQINDTVVTGITIVRHCMGFVSNFDCKIVITNICVMIYQYHSCPRRNETCHVLKF